MKPIGNFVLAAVFSVSVAGLAYAAGPVAPGVGGARGEVGPADSGGGIAPGTIPGTNTPGPDIGRTPAMGTETPPGTPPQPGTTRPGESSLGIERQPLPPGSSVAPDSGLPPPPQKREGLGSGGGLSSPTPGSGGSGSMGGSTTR
jgi:hypothetical protein